MTSALSDNVAGHRSKYEILKACLPPEDVGRMFVGGSDPIWTGYYELEIIRRFKPVAGATIVDIGCGIGRLTQHLLYEDVGAYVGIDIIQEIMDEAVELAKDDPRFRFAIGENCRIPVEDGSVDAIVAYSVITHLLDEETFEYLQEAKRSLKPSGVAIFSFVDFMNPSHAESFFKHASWHRQGHGDLLKYQTKEILRLFGERAGFSSVEFVDSDTALPTSGHGSKLIEQEKIPRCSVLGSHPAFCAPELSRRLGESVDLFDACGDVGLKATRTTASAAKQASTCARTASETPMICAAFKVTNPAAVFQPAVRLNQHRPRYEHPMIMVLERSSVPNGPPRPRSRPLQCATASPQHRWRSEADGAAAGARGPAVLRQPVPKRRSRARVQRVGSNTHDTRTRAALAPRLAVLEEEIDAARCPGEPTRCVRHQPHASPRRGRPRENAIESLQVLKTLPIHRQSLHVSRKWFPPGDTAPSRRVPRDAEGWPPGEAGSRRSVCSGRASSSSMPAAAAP